MSTTLRINQQLNEKWPIYRNTENVPVPNTEKTGHSPVFRSNLHDEYPHSEVNPDLRTSFQCFEHAATLYSNGKCLGFRDPGEPYKYLTYSQVQDKRNAIGSGFLSVVENHKDYHLKISKNRADFSGYNGNKKHDFITAFWGANTVEWALADLMCQAYNITSAGIYYSNDAGTALHILQLTNSPAIFCCRKKIDDIVTLKNKNPRELSQLVILVCYQTIPDELRAKAVEAGLEVYDIHQLESIGRENLRPNNPAGIHDVYTLSFTSGSTGKPKAVVNSHHQLASYLTHNSGHYAHPLPANRIINSLCFLPLGHIYQRGVYNWYLFWGILLALPLSDIPATTFYSDLRASEPHVLTLVPRVMNKLEADLKVYLAEKHGIETHDGSGIPHGVVQAARKHFGLINLIMVHYGSAPMLVDAVRVLEGGLGIICHQGYGLTETFGGCIDTSGVTTKLPERAASTGTIAIGSEFRLKDVPSLNYFYDSKDGVPKGELLLRGPHIFKYYYKDAKVTKESFDEEGFFKTGDVVKLTPNRELTVIDRIKNFFKLSQGEFISPEKLENAVLTAVPFILQIFITGNSAELFLVAIIGFDIERLKHVLTQSKPSSNLGKLSERSLVDAIQNSPELRKDLITLINTMVAEDGVKLLGYEKIHNFYCAIQPLKIEEETLTPTMKLKRPNAKLRFKDVIAELYRQGSVVRKVKL